jgi:hypothetical protein
VLQRRHDESEIDLIKWSLYLIYAYNCEFASMGVENLSKMATRAVEIPEHQLAHNVSQEKLVHEISQEDEKKPRWNRFLRIADEYWLLEWFGLLLAFGSVAGITALLGLLCLFVSWNLFKAYFDTPCRMAQRQTRS